MARPLRKPNGDKTAYTVTMKTELRRKLMAEAEKNHRPLSREIVHRLTLSLQTPKRGTQQQQQEAR